MFLGKDVLKLCSKFLGEHPCRSAISIKLLCSFFEITHWHVCSPVNVPLIFRSLFLKNISGWLLLNLDLEAKQIAESPAYNGLMCFEQILLHDFKRFLS